MTTDDLSHEAGRPPRPPVDEVLATGDLLVDAALRDLAAVAPSDLDGHIETAESLQRTLQARLSNLGD